MAATVRLECADQTIYICVCGYHALIIRSAIKRGMLSTSLASCTTDSLTMSLYTKEARSLHDLIVELDYYYPQSSAIEGAI